MIVSDNSNIILLDNYVKYIEKIVVTRFLNDFQSFHFRISNNYNI